jgi:U3 small nucleolar RNA-associated protein 14
MLDAAEREEREAPRAAQKRVSRTMSRRRKSANVEESDNSSLNNEANASTPGSFDYRSDARDDDVDEDVAFVDDDVDDEMYLAMIKQKRKTKRGDEESSENAAGVDDVEEGAGFAYQDLSDLFGGDEAGSVSTSHATAVRNPLLPQEDDGDGDDDDDEDDDWPEDGNADERAIIADDDGDDHVEIAHDVDTDTSNRGTIANEGEDDFADLSLSYSDDEAGAAGLSLLVDKLAGQRRVKRREAAERVEESATGVRTGDSGGVSLSDLLGSLRNATGLGDAKRDLGRLVRDEQRGASALPAPLSTPASERIERRAAFAATADDISKWDDVVRRNRLAEHLSFVVPHKFVTTTAQMAASFQPHTPLEVCECTSERTLSCV